jgi:adenylate kinase family enzyme
MTYTEDISHEPRPWFRSWPSHLPKHLAYPNVPAWWILERNLERYADKDAVLFLHHEDRTELDRLTYRELWDRPTPWRRACTTWESARETV